MANAMYPSGGKAIMDGNVVFGTNDLRAILIDAGNYTYSDAHDFLNDVGGSGRVATSSALASVTTTDGVLDAADKTLSSVSGASVEAILLYKHTGTESTSYLIFYWDTGVTGLPLSPTGGDVIIQWSASGILSISL